MSFPDRLPLSAAKACFWALGMASRVWATSLVGGAVHSPRCGEVWNTLDAILLSALALRQKRRKSACLCPLCFQLAEPIPADGRASGDKQETDWKQRPYTRKRRLECLVGRR